MNSSFSLQTKTLIFRAAIRDGFSSKSLPSAQTLLTLFFTIFSSQPGVVSKLESLLDWIISAINPKATTNLVREEWRSKAGRRNFYCVSISEGLLRLVQRDAFSYEDVVFTKKALMEHARYGYCYRDVLSPSSVTRDELLGEAIGILRTPSAPTSFQPSTSTFAYDHQRRSFSTFTSSSPKNLNDPHDLDNHQRTFSPFAPSTHTNLKDHRRISSSSFAPSTHKNLEDHRRISSSAFASSTSPLVTSAHKNLNDRQRISSSSFAPSTHKNLNDDQRISFSSFASSTHKNLNDHQRISISTFASSSASDTPPHNNSNDPPNNDHSDTPHNNNEQRTSYLSILTNLQLLIHDAKAQGQGQGQG
ncbi:hypothetical protein AC578_4028 [Pseudocercospora eumusae]|uniref:Uncharacterized protein n=1 Tax=Pseudocercospora eumusae TaxID=321146 RepID=A0A139HDW9_9PEZI|nr:hypothetical protein AC578_4028 [Pseudocercospora eumusae]